MKLYDELRGLVQITGTTVEIGTILSISLSKVNFANLTLEKSTLNIDIDIILFELKLLYCY